MHIMQPRRRETLWNFIHIKYGLFWGMEKRALSFIVIIGEKNVVVEAKKDTRKEFIKSWNFGLWKTIFKN